MRIAFRITEARNTHSEYVRISAFSLQHWLYERASELLHTFISCLVFNMNVSKVYILGDSCFYVSRCIYICIYLFMYTYMHIYAYVYI
jgi:hypothetical protein